MKPDFFYRDEGSIIILLPQTEKAHNWAARNIAIEAHLNCYEICIEQRYFSGLRDKIILDGLIIEVTD